MSHQASRLFRQLLRQSPSLCRSYVGSAEDVKAYQAAKQRALKWVTTPKNRFKHREPTDAGAINAAFARHLFDPLSRLSAASEGSMLQIRDSLSALSTCQAMLHDLEPYMTASNVVRCAERMGQILAYSEKEIWLQSHARCLLHLTEMMQLALLRYSRPEIASLVWSLGKWGPRALSIKLEEDTSIEHLVWRLLGRISEPGVRGELDSLSISQLLDGCIQLNLSPDEALQKLIVEELSGCIEFAEGSIVTRLVLSFAEMKFDVGDKLLHSIAMTAETKIRAGTYPEHQIPLLFKSLGEWQKGRLSLMELCQATDAILEQWGYPEWTLREYTWLLQGFVGLRYFPSWSLLKHIHSCAERASRKESVSVWVTLLSQYAQLGIRPSAAVQHCVAFLDELESEPIDGSPSDAAPVLKSLALLDSLTSDLLTTTAAYLSLHTAEMTEADQLAFYGAFMTHKYLNGDSDVEESLDRFLLTSCREAWQRHEVCTGQRLRDLWSSGHTSDEAGTPQLIILAEGDLAVVALSDREDECRSIAYLDRFHNVRDRMTGEQLWRKRLLDHFGWSVTEITEELGS